MCVKCLNQVIAQEIYVKDKRKIDVDTEPPFESHNTRTLTSFKSSPGFILWFYTVVLTLSWNACMNNIMFVYLSLFIKR